MSNTCRNDCDISGFTWTGLDSIPCAIYATTSSISSYLPRSSYADSLILSQPLSPPQGGGGGGTGISFLGKNSERRQDLCFLVVNENNNTHKQWLYKLHMELSKFRTRARLRQGSRGRTKHQASNARLSHVVDLMRY